MPTELSFKEKFAYGIASMASIIGMQLVNTFAMYFYTDFALIPAMAVMGVLTVARVWDSANDVLVGMHIEKSSHKKLNYKWFIYVFSAPAAIATILMFFSPNADMPIKIAYAVVTYLAWSVLFAYAYTPITCMIGSIAQNSDDRVMLSSYRIFLTIIGILLVNYFSMPLAKFFLQMSSGAGITIAVLLICVVACLLIYIFLPEVKERKVLQKCEKLPIKLMLNALFKSKPLMMLLLFYGFYWIGVFLQSQTAIYFIKYVVQRPDLISAYITFPLVGTLIMQFIIPPAAKKFGLIPLMLFGLLGSVVFMTALAFVDTGNIALIFALSFLFASMTAIPANLILTVFTNECDEREKQLNLSMNAWFFSFLTFAHKMGMSVAGIVVSAVLGATAYVANQVDQASETLVGIKATFFAGTTLALIFCIGFILLYINMKKAENIVQQDELQKSGA